MYQKEKRAVSRGVGYGASGLEADHFQMGSGCFPTKKILRNSPCLPACKQKNIATRLRDTT